MKKKNINRRTFLGTGFTAAAMVTSGKSFAYDDTNKSIPVKKNNEDPFNPVTYNAMPTRSLGKTGYKVGVLSLGARLPLR
jgi:hypothetical protein